MLLVSVLLMCVMPFMANGFLVLPRPNNGISDKYGSTIFSQASTTSLFMAAGGFGGGKSKGMGRSSKGGDEKERKDLASSSDMVKKLKPKQQWDRYSDMKKENKIRVAVRVKNDDINNENSSSEDEEWLEVGNVRSKDNQYAELAVARQRAIIAEHAKRLYPLQVSERKTLEWAYYQDKNEEWIIVDKSVLNTTEANKIENLEKLVGFEGRPDPTTGYYCVYDAGRLKFGEESSFT